MRRPDLDTTTKRYYRDLIGLAALVVVIILGGLIFTKSYHLTLLTYSGIYAIAALGMFLLFGYCGQISIGQSAFFGIGAYVSALLVMRAGFPSILAIGIAVTAAGIVGWITSRPILKLETNYLAIATLAFGVIAYVIFSQATALTGGLDPGVFGVPALDVFGFQFSSTRSKFWIVGAFMCLSMLIIINVIHSRAGRAFKALKGSEVAAAGFGIDVVRFKLAAYTIAAALAGLAGALFGFVQGSFSASTFTVSLSIELLVMVVVGSLSSPWGALFGAYFVTIVPTFLEDFEQYKLLVFGCILLVVTIFMPDGLARAGFVAAGSLSRRLRAP